MKKTISKVYQISDIIQWDEKGELELSPKYQRNSVWNEKAKSYLIDTIIRGLPIPPIFIRQKVDVLTRTTNREIIDGQQRIRAIIEYVVDEKYSIKRSHNKNYGGKKYSDLDEDTQEAILEYEIIAETVTEKDESLVYDMFARLNSNNYVLNRQEIRNAKFWGDFKVLVYNLASHNRRFFIDFSLLSDSDFTRMRDVELINSMVILIKEGIVSETPTYVDKVYEKYDYKLEDGVEVDERFNSVMNVIEKIYNYYNGHLGCLSNKNYLFTLYSVLYNQMFGIVNTQLYRNIKYRSDKINDNIEEVLNICGRFLNDYNTMFGNDNASQTTDKNWNDFKKYHSFRTTSKNERTSRISFLNDYFSGGNDD